MKTIRILVISFLLILSACSENGTDPGGETDGEKNVATIGTDGGSVTNDEVTLTVPAGAFGSSEQVSVTETVVADHNFENVLTKIYRVEGIPESYNSKLRIKFKYEGNINNTPLIAVGEEIFLSNQNELEKCYNLFEAKDSSGYLICELPAPEDMGLQKSSAAVSNKKVKMYLFASDGNFSQDSDAGHFRIYFQSLSMRSDVEKLAKYLEEAHDKFIDWNYDVNHRTKWPVKVVVKNLKPGTNGEQCNSVWGDNYGYIHINKNIMSDHNELKVTAAHEFFHIIQAFYDSRNRVSKASSGGDQYWVDEASAVWIEEYFSSNANYVSGARNGNTLSPFNGIQPKASVHGGEHGYGMSSLIKYIVEQNDKDYVKTIYENLKGGKHPIEALTNNSYELWLHEYYRSLVSNQLYKDMPIEKFIGNAAGSYKVNTKTDTLKTFEANYQDLSAKFFYVNLSYNDFSEFSSLKCSIPAGANQRLLIYKYTSAGAVYLKSTSEYETINNLKELKDSGQHLLFVVVNGKNSKPYFNETSVPLKIEIFHPKELAFDFRKSRSMNITLRNVIFKNSEGKDMPTDLSFVGNGSWNGNTFTGTKNGETVSATFNPVTKELTFSGNQVIGNLSASISGTLIKPHQPTILEGYYVFGDEYGALYNVISTISYKFGSVNASSGNFDGAILIITFYETEF